MHDRETRCQKIAPVCGCRKNATKNGADADASDSDSGEQGLSVPEQQPRGSLTFWQRNCGHTLVNPLFEVNTFFRDDGVKSASRS
jgi:hypothetical protein